jgi:ATP phosphoribosyltransferase
VLRFGVPRGGRIGPAAVEFLDSCGLSVRQQHERQLTATISGLPGVSVILQRARDIVRQVADGEVDVGMTGEDFLLEFAPEDADLVTLYPQLGFSSGDIVVAVPDSWADVATLADLADVSIAMRERGEQLRVATGYARLAQRFLYEKGITYFTIVLTEGSVEASPVVGFADAIVELTASGVSLRENRLKVLRNGLVMHSECTLVGNRRALTRSVEKRELTRRIVELIEARLRAQGYYSVTANMRGKSERDVADALLGSPATHGMRGPTVARVFTAEPEPDGSSYFAATIIVGANALQPAVDHLRAAGGEGMSVVPVRYLFDDRSQHFSRVLAELGK